MFIVKILRVFLISVKTVHYFETDGVFFKDNIFFFLIVIYFLIGR